MDATVIYGSLVKS